MPRLSWTMPALCLLLVATGVAAQALEIIELRNRPADQLLPVVQGLVEPGGSISGTGFKLIVRASPANVAQIRQVVASLDRAPRQLVISVMQESGGASSAAGAGARVILQPGASGVRASAYNGTGTAQDNVSQQVRTQEGSAAYLQTGSSMFAPQRTVTRGAGGVVIQDTAVERRFNTGFHVTPRISGDVVFLDIGVQRDTPANIGVGGSSVNRVASTISGKLGEWIELGVVSQALSSDTRGILSRSSDAAAQERRVFVRVEEAR